MKNRMKVEFWSESGCERFARTVAAAFVLDADPTVDEMEELKTAVSEAVTNSVVHAYPETGGIIRIEGELEDGGVTYIITDYGCGIEDIERAKRPLYSSSKDGERSGMGFSIMEAFTDVLSVKSEMGAGTVITMKKRFERYV